MTLRMPDRFCAIDSETTGLYPYAGDYPFAVGLSWDNGEEEYYRDEGLRNPRLKSIMEDPGVDKIMHNQKFDWKMLNKAGIEPRGRMWDTGILCHLVDGRDAEGGLNLDDCAKKYLPAEFRKVVDEIDTWFNENGHKDTDRKERYRLFQELPDTILRKRVCGDADLTRRLFIRLYPTVAKVFPLLLDMERRLTPVVKRMEDRGILTDANEIQHQMVNFETMVEEVSFFCERVLGREWFNINSPNDQRDLLIQAGIYQYITEETKPNKKRKSLKPFIPKKKLDAWNLQQLHHPVAAMLLVGKMAQKMISPFLTQALEFCVDGVIHANFKQIGTTSGRFSCAEPNLQNIPVEGEHKASYTEDEARELYEMTGYQFAPHIKRIFPVRPGFCHIHSDKKQAEMVALAHYSNSQKMIDAFVRGDSIHDAICKELFNEITKGLKQRSKACTFGYQYGAGLPVLAKKINGTLAEAYRLKQRYAGVFPDLPKWVRILREEIHAKGYVQTDHGRRHYLWKNEDYMAVNRVCQGHVGDEVKGRMVAIGESIENGELRGSGATIVLNIHDDLATEVPLEHAPEVGPILYRLMQETMIPHKCPMPSSMDITFTRWSDLKEIKDPTNPDSYRAPKDLKQEVPGYVDTRTHAQILVPSLESIKDHGRAE